MVRSGGEWLQFATDPQSPDSGPVRCCDVMDLCQAFSQPTGPGRLWISLSAVVLQRSSWGRVLCDAFLSAAFPGLLKFLITGLEDGLVATKQFILRGDVTDSGEFRIVGQPIERILPQKIRAPADRPR